MRTLAPVVIAAVSLAAACASESPAPSPVGPLDASAKLSDAGASGDGASLPDGAGVADGGKASDGALAADAANGSDAGGEAPALWWYTCGDPVCHGYKPGATPKCTSQKQGDPCTLLGDKCDPVDDCNRKLVCATKDPTKDPGGCPISRRDAKTEIAYLDATGAEALYRDVLGLRLATYRYRFQPASAPRRLGFLLDDVDPAGRHAPPVDPERDMVDLYGYTSMAIAAVQTEARHVEALEREVGALRRELDELRRTTASRPRARRR